MKDIKNILNFGFKFINKYKYRFVLYIILSLLINLIGIVIPLITGQIVDLITGTNVLMSLQQLVGTFVVLIFIQFVLTYITNLQYVNIQSESGYMANIFSIEKIYNASYREICNINPSSLHQMINNDCNIIVIFCITLFRDFFANLAIVFIVFIIVFNQSVILSIMFIFLVMCYSVLYYIFKNKLYDQSLKVKNTQSNFFGKLYNLLGNLRSIKINGFFSRTVEKQNLVFETYKHELVKEIKLSNIFDFLTSAITMSAQVFLYLYGGNMVLLGNMSIGIFVVLVTYFSKLLSSTDYFLHLGTYLQNVKSSYDRLMQYTNHVEYKYGKLEINSIDSIHFDNVSFNYDKETVFELNKRFEKGKIYWIKGSNGSGKTTFINLLAGLFGLDFRGDIFINDYPLKDIDFSKVRSSNMSIVEQRPFILSESLNDNLFCKSRSESYSEERNTNKEFIFDKFNIANIANLKREGYDTELDSVNDEVSGGERQKIALVRTFLSSSDIWIFDEPTSALDTDSKKNFYELIDKYRKSKLIFIISHESFDSYDEIIEF
ncbi:ABC transporter ATP-binding protein [Tissierella sp.]|uniref:ABC transporter ATP-binding protein n=1 Tax=Tissierella sp. TaxID=41274 RepID=UPI002861880F|nr:ABC transporter ATP-binding protein [Tissierella sp.]MDR7856493.1 ABC transporter ATP-binding protein [Tissierella sp.]